MDQDRLAQLAAALPANLASHLMLSTIALAAGLAISLPLGITLARSERLRYPVLTLVSVIQTVPSLALLALMVPLLVGLGALTERAWGWRASALGFWPTIIALTLYSMLPIVRNTVTGILGCDGAITEAARGVGMTPRQVLWRVQLPLAAPTILAGVRTATVWVVGIATLSTPVGQRSLGNFIFKGLQTQNWPMVIVGCVAAALLAVVLDTLLGMLEKSVATRHKARAYACSGLLMGVLLVGLCAPSLVRTWSAARGSAGPARQLTEADVATRLHRPIRIGAKTFTEQFILAQLLADTLAEAGYTTERREGLGSTVIFSALAAGELDVYVDYSGTIWANQMQRQGSAPADVVLDEVTWWLAINHTVRCLGSLGFENSYALAMRREQAETLEIQTIAELAARAGEWTLAGDYEFFGRPEWRGLRDRYQLRPRRQREMDATFIYPAIASGEVDLISAFSSDGRIVAYDLVTLADTEQIIPPYDAVILLSAAAAEDTHLVAALRKLLGTISLESMRNANYLVDRDNDPRSVAEAARLLRGN